ncbi:RraA family protein [Paraburkholderia sp. BL18I3N2]|uniref:RraA family protein n=1 Tax=Paraburkholderia sp. BL18I3N2 TaxID=1938799 RepID=UPI000D06CF95|nr:RraA family protein [Paraburkholderia sp. BL18I3N2]PRX21647.1 RraA family protein [Paraburkholderia sp. BL18I3N2]
MIGFKIHARARKADSRIVEQFRNLPVANVSDVMSRMTAGGAALRPMHDGTPMVGPALTVKCRPGDNLMVHKALDLAEPGDVVVVDAGGDLTNALIGELMTWYAASRKLGGIVINGAIRDAATIKKNPFPVYAAGVTHRGPYKDGPGEINVTVALDGMCIEPGDLVIADADGILCVPFDYMEQVYQEASEKHHAEEKTIVEIEEGRLDTSWVDARLRNLGCEGL